MDNERDYEVSYVAGGPDTVLGVLDLFSTSAEGIAKFSHLVIAEVEEGRVDALKIALFMKTLEKIKERVNEVLAPYYLTAAEKYGTKMFEFAGAKIEIGDVGVSYDYSGCGHHGWNDLKKILEETKEQMKEYETLLKPLTKPLDLIIEGEGVTVRPPVRKGKEGIKITIK